MPNELSEIKKLRKQILDVGGVMTSVTAVGADLPITAAATKDIIMKLGANDTSKKFSIIDSDGVEVAKVDGNGLITSAAGLVGPVTGNLTGNVLGIETLTAKTATDMTLIADGDEDIIFKMGDALGANKILFKDSASALQASLDSDGTFTAKKLVGPVTFAHSDTAGAPTNDECVSAFGAAATVGAGFIGVYLDDHESGKTYLCVSNGTAYVTVEATAAA